eukprot:764980-Rhodomonas_salina.1
MADRCTRAYKRTSTGSLSDAISLRACYAMRGTGEVYGAIAAYAMRSTDIARPRDVLHAIRH